MSFKVGTVECQCYNIMGMPSDTGKCTVEGCDEKKTFFGEKTYSRLVEWSEEHSKTHEGLIK